MLKPKLYLPKSYTFDHEMAGSNPKSMYLSQNSKISQYLHKTPHVRQKNSSSELNVLCGKVITCCCGQTLNFPNKETLNFPNRITLNRSHSLNNHHINRDFGLSKAYEFGYARNYFSVDDSLFNFQNVSVGNHFADCTCENELINNTIPEMSKVSESAESNEKEVENSENTNSNINSCDNENYSINISTDNISRNSNQNMKETDSESSSSESAEPSDNTNSTDKSSKSVIANIDNGESSELDEGVNAIKLIISEVRAQLINKDCQKRNSVDCYSSDEKDSIKSVSEPQQKLPAKNEHVQQQELSDVGDQDSISIQEEVTVKNNCNSDSDDAKFANYSSLFLKCRSFSVDTSESKGENSSSFLKCRSYSVDASGRLSKSPNLPPANDDDMSIHCNNSTISDVGPQLKPNLSVVRKCSLKNKCVNFSLDIITPDDSNASEVNAKCTFPSVQLSLPNENGSAPVSSSEYNNRDRYVYERNPRGASAHHGHGEHELRDQRDMRVDRDHRDRERERDRDGVEGKRAQFTRSLSNTEAPPDEKTGNFVYWNFES